MIAHINKLTILGIAVLFSFNSFGYSQAEMTTDTVKMPEHETSASAVLAPKSSFADETASVDATSLDESKLMENISDESLKAKLEDTKTTETEQLAVANSAELLKLLGVLPQDLAQKKSNEKNERIDAAVSEQQFQQMLGANPRVIYRTKENHETFTDPMIIPWIRNAVIVREMLYEVNLLLAAGKVTQACTVLKDIATKYPDTEETQYAKDTLVKIQQLRDKADAQKLVAMQPEGESMAHPVVEIVLDPNLVINSVMQDIQHPQDSIVIINGKLYHVGDEISGTFPKHYIKLVKEDSIVIEVKASNTSKEFTINVKKNQ